MRHHLLLLPFITIIFGCTIATGDDPKETICSVNTPEGRCPEGQVCTEGKCITPAQPCSAEHPQGYCFDNFMCHEGSCLEQCSAQAPEGYCPEGSTCTEGTCRAPCSLTTPDGYCADGFFCNGGTCAEGVACSPEHPEGYCDPGLVCEEGACTQPTLDLGEFQTFDGRFAQLYHFESTTRVYGIDTFSVTKTILLLDQVQVGNEVHILATVCDIDITNGQMGLGPVQIIVPDAFVNSLHQTNATLYLTESGGEVVITQPDLVEIRGALFQDPANDTMPADASDPRVIDQDQDGNPGMTLVATGVVTGEMYTVQRTITAVNGTITSADTFDGEVIWSDEQVVLDAENSALIQEMNSTPDLDQSRFYTTRVPAGTTCDTIIATQADLFGR